MYYQVKYLGGPKHKHVENKKENKLPPIEKVHKLHETTEPCSKEFKPTNEVTDIGTYYLYPMAYNEIKYYIYVYEDALKQFKAKYLA